LKRILIATIVILLVVAVSIGYYWVETPKPTQIRIDGVTLTVELATTPAEQSKGLSGRDSLPPDHGMLFVFASEGMWGFWMKDMKFSLDIIWFNSSREMVYAEQGLQPCSPDICPIYTPPVEATYVLEVNAGFVSAHNIALGDMFSYLTP
jgi:uncharacterized membrane protein (UPF0127 family)